ncbi:MAG: DivIVA domain-containing protein [Gemmatimonadetes bacterium]|nr:DivIVA domain-containing protein [Gemmatimonadota bacterium]
MDISPEEIRSRKFKLRWVSGYDMDEVEAFLNTAASAFETLVKENESLRGKLAEMDGELTDIGRRRKLLEDALVSAQRVIHDMKANAMKEAENVLKEAENQADRWIADANSQVSEIKRELRELTSLRKDYEVKFRFLLESHKEQLEAMRSTENENGQKSTLDLAP